jgi:hypothetical protein
MKTLHIIPNVILLVSMLFSIHATSQFSQQAKIVSPNRESRAEYGTATDIRGNYAIVGSPRHNIAAGAAYIYEKNGEGQWEYLQSLIADDALEMAEFGGAVKMTEDYIVVASGRADIGSEIRAGALYVYNKSGQAWDFSSKIVASNYSGDDKLGMNNTSIDAQGDIIVGGAPGANGWVGRVYVFERSEEVWNEVQIIENPANTNDTFGISVALSGDLMVIGANESNGLKGSAYIYYKDSNGFWVMQQQITASDSAAEDFFGTSVSVDGETIVVGAYGHQGFKGAAYIFKKDSSGVWIQSQKLISSTQIPEAYFGWQCEIQGTNLIVGAPHIYASTQGEVFIFRENGDGEWVETQLVQSDDISAEDFYGWAVALFEDQIVVGAPWEDEDESGNNPIDRAGSAYIFKNPTLGTPDFSSPANEVVCYPNPADNIFIIESKTAALDRIKIYGINGILLQELYVKGGKTAQLHIQDLAKGVYLVQIEQQGGFNNYQKMVKQ